MSLSREERTAKYPKHIHYVTKTRLNMHTFAFDRVVKVGRRDFVTRGRVDGKRIYFLEHRDCFGYLEQSTSYFNLTELKKHIRK